MKNQKKSISLTITDTNVDFVNNLSDDLNRNRSEVIDDILSKYRKFKLKKDIENGFKSQSKQDIDESMSDFDDYLKIIL